MKWIGQYIVDLIARFRSDVYLENLSTTSEDEILVVDSNGKISKKNESTLAIDVSDFMASGADNRVLTATGTDAMQAEQYLTFENGSNISDLRIISNEDATNDYSSLSVTTDGVTKLASYSDTAGRGPLTFDGHGGVKITAPTDAGNPVLTITSVDVDKSTLKLSSEVNTTSFAQFIDCNALTTGGAISIDVDDEVTGDNERDLRL